MQATLHSGDMKSKSTTIQHWLHHDADLLEEDGFHTVTITLMGIHDRPLASYALCDDRNATEPRRECGITSATEGPAHRREIEKRLAHEIAAPPPTARAVVVSHEMLLWPEPRRLDPRATPLKGNRAWR